MGVVHLASGVCRRSCCLLEHAISTASPHREGQVGEQEIERAVVVCLWCLLVRQCMVHI